jgi:hypothetical protein
VSRGLVCGSWGKGTSTTYSISRARTCVKVPQPPHPRQYAAEFHAQYELMMAGCFTRGCPMFIGQRGVVDVELWSNYENDKQNDLSRSLYFIRRK